MKDIKKPVMTNSESAAEKKALRRRMKQTLALLAPEVFHAEGAAAARRLAETALWRRYDRVLAYLSMPCEIDTTPLLECAFREKKQVFVPKIMNDEQIQFFRIMPDTLFDQQNAFQIREPRETPEALFEPEDGPALVISPGLAFDRAGGRIGRGKGYYDRFYASLLKASPSSAICALCLSSALVEAVPLEPFDQKIHALCTPDDFFEINF